MNKAILISVITCLSAPLASRAVDIGGAAATDVNNWTTNSEVYLQGTTDGFSLNWENVLTNTAETTPANNNFDVAFETDTNYTIGHIYLYNEALDLSTLGPGGIEKMSWVADFDGSAMQNWIPVIAVTDGGTTTFYRSNNAGNSWNGGGIQEFATGNADSTFWVDLIGDPIGGINESRGFNNVDFQAATGMMQFGFIQWGASTNGIVSPVLEFTTAIEQFDITINEEPPLEEITDLKNSSEFPTQYDGGDIYDGISYINDWDLPGAAGTDVVSTLDEPSGILTVTNADNNGWIQQDNDVSPWETGTAAGGSWTAEVRVKMAPDADNTFVFWGANGSQRGILQINTNSVDFFNGDPLDENDNTDDFHVFRMVYDAGFNRYFIWRDGVSLTPTAGLPKQADTGQSRFIVGDCCSSFLMTSVDIDYVRYDTTGSFAPGPDGPPLEITQIIYDQETHLVTLTWRSVPGTFYAIQGSLDMVAWPIDVDDGTQGTPESDTTTISFTAELSPPVAGEYPTRAFYRVLLAE